MRVIVINRTSFNVIDISSVNSIALSGTNYVITKGGTTTNYAIADYIVRIIG